MGTYATELEKWCDDNIGNVYKYDAWDEYYSLKSAIKSGLSSNILDKHASRFEHAINGYKSGHYNDKSAEEQEMFIIPYKNRYGDLIFYDAVRGKKAILALWNGAPLFKGPQYLIRALGGRSEIGGSGGIWNQYADRQYFNYNIPKLNYKAA